MKTNLKIVKRALLMLLATAQVIGCTKDPVIQEIIVEDQTTNPNVVGDKLSLNVFDARELSTKALENDASTEFQPGDQIGLFIVIDDYLQQFNECYTMNSNGVWTGQGAYWGDESSDVYYYAYYPYMKSACFDSFYDTTLNVVDEDDYHGEVDGTQGTGTPDGRAPLFDNEFEAVTDSETGLKSYKVTKRGTKYLVAPISGGTTEERSAEYFFHDIIGKWQPRRYQAGNGYTLSDLMVCKGYFSQTNLGQYPLTLALKHQMSMLHFEFPSNYKFDIGTDGQGSLVAIDQPAEYKESYKFPEGFIGSDDTPVDGYTSMWDENSSAGDTEDGSTHILYSGAGEPEPSSVMEGLDADDIDRGELDIYIDPVKNKGTEVIAGINDIHKFMHDLTEIEGSYYWREDSQTPVLDADGNATSEMKDVIGSHNEFRYIIRPHNSEITNYSSYSGALVHINYTYMDVKDGEVIESNGKAVTVENSYNANFEPLSNAYVHYMMDDGDIPVGEPSLIRTETPNTNDWGNAEETFFPTCVGAFWKHNQCGERIVKIQPSYPEDYGEWRAFVYQMDSNWDSNTDIRLSTDVSNITYDDDAEAHPITTKSQSVQGTCGAGNPIVFKIGLTQTPWDMKNRITNFYTPARYAVVMLIYGNGEKYQLIYLRQGEDPDYVFSKYDTYKNANGVDVNRPYASKLSPYNLTSQEWKDNVPNIMNGTAFDTEPANGQQLRRPYADSPNETEPLGAFVDYPSQIGGYFPAGTGGDNVARIYNAIQEPGNTLQINASWIEGSYEVCPKGAPSADGTHIFNYERPAAGIDSNFDASYDGTASQFENSLFLVPNEPANNCQSGYYADGFHDRRQTKLQYTTRNASSTGMLFYNPANNASVFLPAAGNKAHSYRLYEYDNILTAEYTADYWANILVIPNPGVAFRTLFESEYYPSTLPAYGEIGVYMTRSAHDTNNPYFYLIEAPTNQTTNVPDFATNPKEHMFCDERWGVTYHDVVGSLRPFVQSQTEATIE